MKRVGPCKILAKHGNNAYKVDLHLDLNISSVFNVEDMIKFKGASTEMDLNNKEVSKDVTTEFLPPQVQLETN